MAAARPPPKPVNPPGRPLAPLGRLLDNLERAHKADVREYTGGHLNESRLYRPPDPARGNRLLDRGAGRATAAAPGAADFATEPRVPVRRVKLPPPPPTVAASASAASSRQQPPSETPGKTALHREALVEELLLPAAPPQRLLAPAAGEGSHAGNYRRARMIRRQLVREQDTMEQDMMSGYSAVRDLEIRLQENLRQHFGNSSGPSFHRLQMYSAALDEIIAQSATFGSTLEHVKAAYDDYLAWLVDSTAPAQHRHLRAQLTQLRDPRAEAELAELRGRLVELEAAGEAALAGLADNRRRLAEAEAVSAAESAAEAAAAAAAPPPPSRSKSHVEDEEEESSADRCERLLREVWASLDEAADLRQELRTRRSPLVCAAHLERCCRQAHGEMQAVEEELARVAGANSAALEGLLAQLASADNVEVEEGAVAEDSRRRLLRLLGSEAAAAALASETLDLDPELLLASADGGGGEVPGGAADDPHKWDWYIS